MAKPTQPNLETLITRIEALQDRLCQTRENYLQDLNELESIIEQLRTLAKPAVNHCPCFVCSEAKQEVQHG